MTKKLINGLLTFAIVLLLIFALITLVIRIFGIKPYAVLSGSMEPDYPVGSMIYVKAEDPQEIKVGDTVTFVMNKNLDIATHRVVKIDLENESFYTKGDANIAQDAAAVHFKNLLGKVIFSVPKLGYIASFASKPPGIYMIVGLAFALVLAAAFLPSKEKKEETILVDK